MHCPCRASGAKEDWTTTSSTSTEPLLAGADTRDYGFDPFQVMSECNPQTGRVHCIMTCQGKQVVFQLQSRKGGDTVTMMTATRGRIWSRTKYVLSVAGGHAVASLMELQSNVSQHAYALELPDNVGTIAYILYRVPSLSSVFRHAPPARQAEMALLDTTTKPMMDFATKQTMFQVSRVLSATPVWPETFDDLDGFAGFHGAPKRRAVYQAEWQVWTGLGGSWSVCIAQEYAIGPARRRRWSRVANGQVGRQGVSC